mgnify:CR=1 FL=1|jgi:hypothetical protein
MGKKNVKKLITIYITKNELDKNSLFQFIHLVFFIIFVVIITLLLTKSNLLETILYSIYLASYIIRYFIVNYRIAKKIPNECFFNDKKKSYDIMKKLISLSGFIFIITFIMIISMVNLNIASHLILIPIIFKKIIRHMRSRVLFNEFYNNNLSENSLNNNDINDKYIYCVANLMSLNIIRIHNNDIDNTNNTPYQNAHGMIYSDWLKTRSVFSTPPDNECSICLEDYKYEDNIIEFDCKHIFHTPCLLKYTDNKKSFPCPLCTKEINRNTYVIENNIPTNISPITIV